MAVKKNFNNVAYGLGNPLQSLATPPIRSQRAPVSTDFAQVGTIWIYEPNNSYYILTSITGGSANWEGQAGGSGTFSAVSVTGNSGTVLQTAVGGNTVLGGTLAVTGTTTLTGNLVVNGDTSINGDFDISSGASLSWSTSSTLSLAGAAGVTISSTNSAISVASGTGTLSVSADAAATTVNVATGAGAKTLNLGSTNSTSATTVQSGATGSISVNSNGGTLGILSGTGAISFSADAAATTINIGTGAAAKAVTLGSLTSSSSVTIQGGTGAAGSINIGSSAHDVPITIGNSTGATAISIIGGSSGILLTGTNGVITANSGTGTISVSSDAAATTVNIANGNAVKGLTLGSTNTSSSTIVQAGSGNVKISGGTIRTLTAVQNSSPYVVAATDDYIQIDSSGGAIQVNLPNAPVTGRIYTIKDETGSAATHNITLTTVGGTVHIDGAATLTISTAWQAVRVIFNGTLYLTI